MLADTKQQEGPQGGNSGKRRRIKLPKNSKLNKRLINEFNSFLEFVPPDRLSRNLRNLLLSNLEIQKDRPLYFEDLVVDLYFLFQFLDVASEEVDSGK